MVVQFREQVLDRRPGRLTEHGDDLVHRPRSVEQGKEHGNEVSGRRTFDADNALAVLEHDPGVLRYDAIPGREVRELHAPHLRRGRVSSRRACNRSGWRTSPCCWTTP